MLAALVRWSLRSPLLVGLIATLILALGSNTVLNGSYDVFPEFVPPEGEIQTEAPGLVSEQVEQLITQPLENAVSGVPGVEVVRSESIAGLSVIEVLFKLDTDPFRGRQLLAERVAEAARSLPQIAGSPTLGPMTSSTMDLLKVGLISEHLSAAQLRTIADWTVAPRLQSVSGVAAVHVFGGAVRELQVTVRAVELHAAGLTLSQVLSAAAAAVGQRGSGFVDTAAQRVLVQTGIESPTPAELGMTVITRHTGRNIRIADVADVSWGAAPAFGDARIQGKPGVLLALLSQYGANTLEVTRSTEAALEALRPVLAAEGVTLTEATHRPATFIESALANMRNALLLGAALVLLVLTLFLRDWRTALISFVSIPLSLLGAVIVIHLFGWTINTMTLGGLAVAVGVVVDDAIIDVENIVRRLRRAAIESAIEPREVIILAASLEVRRPVVLATFIVGMVFLPILLMSGLQGSFFMPLAASFLLATFASLLVALTVTPALCLLLHPGPRHREPRWLRRIKYWQGRALRRLVPHARPLLLATLLVGAAAVVGLWQFGSELLPAFREGHFVLQADMQAGTSIAEMGRMGETISREILALDGVKSISQQVGRASGAEDTWPPNQSEFHVELKSGVSAAAQQDIEAALHRILKSWPGLKFEVLSFLGDRIGESLGGESAPVAVNIYGPDLDQLDELSKQATALLDTLTDAGEIAPANSVAVPTLRIQLLPEKLALYGLRPAEVLADVSAANQGSVVGEIYDGAQAMAVRVRLDQGTGTEPEAIGDLLLPTPTGNSVALKSVAEVGLAGSRNSVLHDGGRRRQVIDVTPSTRDLNGFVARARQLLKDQLKLPPGYYLEFTGSAAEVSAARNELLWHSSFAALAILLLLAFAFPNLPSVLLILANLPFALTGGVLAVALTGGVLSIGTLVGFVTLFGICARNTIMLLSHYEHLQRSEGAHWSARTALRGARERLTPILMTALVTALGLLPLALGGGQAGREIEAPMATVILFGLASSTLLNILVMPVLAARYLRPVKN